MTKAFLIAFPIVLIIFVSGCQSGGHRYSREESIKFDQYVFQGKQLYLTHCLNCHQKDGTGLGKLIPPLKTNFISANKELAICSIKHGLEGQIVVNGTSYNGIMPNNPRLTPLEIAEIMTYISNSWGNDYGMIGIDEVENALKQCNN